MTRAASYARGGSSAPLLEETIGANLERTVARFGDREALVSCAQDRRYTYAELGAAVDRAGARTDRRRPGPGRPGGDLEPQLRRVDARAVRDRQAGRDPGQRQPRLPDLGARVRAAPVRLPDADRAPARSRPRTTARWSPRCATACPSSSGWCSSTARSGTSWRPATTASRTTTLRARSAELDAGDPINIQYTSGTTGFPKGATLTHRNILNNGFFVGEGCRYTHEDRVCIPVPFYHCFGMVMGNLALHLARGDDGDPGAGLRPRGDARGRLRRALHLALRRPDDVHRDARASRNSTRYDLDSLRTGIMAGSPCPVEVMKRVIERMHMSEVGICYGMTETSPVSTQTAFDDPLEKRVGTRRPRPAARRGQDRRSGARGEVVAARRERRAVHPRLQRDDRLLERPRAHRRGDRRRRVDAHRGSGDDGRRGLRQHRRADQGHGHPRRRERLSPGDRGVPVRPPGHLRRPGDRRSRRALRRGADGLDRPARRSHARRRGGARRSARAASPTTRSPATSSSSTASR